MTPALRAASLTPRFAVGGAARKEEDKLASAAEKDERIARHLKDPRVHGSATDARGRIRRRSALQNEDLVDEGEEQQENEGPVDLTGDGTLNPEEEVELEDDVAAFVPSDTDMTEATRRVAVVNCDWDHVHAKDIFAIFSHCVPFGRKLLSVQLYLSDFGRTQTEKEKQLGPDLWVRRGEEGFEEAKKEHTQKMAASNGAEETEEQEEQEEGGELENSEEPKEEEEEYFSSGKHRLYEISRMKYYYAVATFDSAETASAVYRLCDGVDIEASGVVLDLRYVDDSETFSEKPVETVSRIPPDFKPLKAFKSSALTQSRFSTSWDQDDAQRAQTVRDSFDETEEADLAVYLASDSSENDEASGEAQKQSKESKRAAIRAKYSALLEDIGGLAPDAEAGNMNREEPKEDASQSSNDDDLNQLNDVELNTSDVEELDVADDAQLGDREVTMHMDTEERAATLQRKFQRKLQTQNSDVGTLAQLKYKEKRKAAKRAKLDALAQQGEAVAQLSEAERSAQMQQLKETFGDHVETRKEKLSGKARKKEHSKEVKQQAAQNRSELKRKRMVAAQGGNLGEEQKQQSPAKDSLDERFRKRLVEDARFHIDLRSKATNKEDAVRTSRLAEAVRSERKHAGAVREGLPKAAAKDSLSTAVNYFLQQTSDEPQHKKQRVEQ